MTNETAPIALTRSIHPTLNILSYTYVCLASLSLAVLLYLVKFVILDETLSLGNKLTWRAVSNKFNIALLIGNVSITAYYALEVVTIFDDPRITSLCGAAAYFCFAGLQTCLMWYTWLRAEAIFDIVFAKLLPFMRIMIPAATVVLYVPSVVAVIAAVTGSSSVLTAVSHLTIAVSSLLLLLFDIIVCVSFSLYLRKANATVGLLDAQNDRFRITCFYGLVTSLFEGLSVFGYVFALTRVSFLEYQTIMVVVRALVLCGYSTLVLLKVALHRQKEGRRAVRTISTGHSTYSSRFSSLPRSKTPVPV
ncbi:hypothetical protein HDU78_002863 [Chytriomyces hyalinus]|nr:hypothetical protein HDU78_002863 [Chytriomyces hyalinus]